MDFFRLPTLRVRLGENWAFSVAPTQLISLRPFYNTYTKAKNGTPLLMPWRLRCSNFLGLQWMSIEVACQSLNSIRIAYIFKKFNCKIYGKITMILCADNHCTCLPLIFTFCFCSGFWGFLALQCHEKWKNKTIKPLLPTCCVQKMSRLGSRPCGHTCDKWAREIIPNLKRFC